MYRTLEPVLTCLEQALVPFYVLALQSKEA